MKFFYERHQCQDYSLTSCLPRRRFLPESPILATWRHGHMAYPAMCLSESLSYYLSSHCSPDIHSIAFYTHEYINVTVYSH